MAITEESSETRSSFVRQRRFLIGTSLTILGYGYLGLSVSQVNVLGNTADVKNPGHLAVVLIMVHAWAIYRYWTHFHELAPWRPFRDARLERWRQLLTPSNWASRRTEGEDFARFYADNAPEIERLRDKDKIHESASANCSHLAQVSGGSTSTMCEEWNIPFYSQERETQVGYVTLRVPVGRWRARRALCMSWMLMLLNRSFFSEYIVPIGLATVAVVAYATNWFDIVR